MSDGRVLVPLLVIAMALGGCSSDDADVAAGGRGDDEAETDEFDDEDVGSESPLYEFLGWADADLDAEDEQTENAARALRAEELTATCMREQGFEYIPVDWTAQMIFEAAGEADLGMEWGSDEFVRTYGFGITTLRFGQEQVGPDLLGHEYPTYEEDGENGFVDPNEDYVESLTEAERAAYEAALYGTQIDVPVPDWEREGREPTEEEIEAMDAWLEESHVPGCREKSSREVLEEVDEERHQRFYEEFGDLLGEARQRVMASPEVVAYHAEVEACTNGRGYEYLTGDEWYSYLDGPYMYFEEKLDEAGLRWQDPLEGVDTTGWTDEQLTQAHEDYETRRLEPEQLEALAELQEEEIGMAVAVHECGGGSRDVEAVLEPLMIEMERQFLEDHADRLAPYEGLFGDG